MRWERVEWGLEKPSEQQLEYKVLAAPEAEITS